MMTWQNIPNKEWRRDEYLKEFEDALIPSSQQSIDWQESDEDDIQCLTFPKKRRYKEDVSKSIVKKTNYYESICRNKITNNNLSVSPVFKKSNSAPSTKSYEGHTTSAAASLLSHSAVYPESDNKMSVTVATSHSIDNQAINKYIKYSKRAESPEIIDVVDNAINCSNYSTHDSTFRASTSKILSPNIGKKTYDNNYNNKRKVNLYNIEKNITNRKNVNTKDASLQFVKCNVSKNGIISQITSPKFNSSKAYRQEDNSKNVTTQFKNAVQRCKKNIYQEICISDSKYEDSQCVNETKNYCSTSNASTYINDFLKSTCKKNADEIEIVDIINYNELQSKKHDISLPTKEDSNILAYKDIDPDDLKIVHTNLIQNDSIIVPFSKEFYNIPSENYHKIGFNQEYLGLSTLGPVNCTGNNSKAKRHSNTPQQLATSSLISRNFLMIANNNISAPGKDNLKRNCYIEDTDSEKEYSERMESCYQIDTSLSPTSDIIKKKWEAINGHVLTERKYQEYSMESNCGNQNIQNKTGFKWVKDLIKTPEKVSSYCNNPDIQVQEAPDSSKKKLKKEGHADHLQKLIKSWQSDVAMFNHQMAQVNSNLLLSCSYYPTVENNSLSVGEKVSCTRLNINQSQEACFDQLSVLHNDGRYSNDGIPLHQSSGKDLSYNYNGIKKNHNKHGNSSAGGQNTINISPKTSQINKLQQLGSSLDVSPASTSSLSSCKSFLVPQKHICLEITWVSTNIFSSETMSVECKVTDHCYSALTERRKCSSSSSFSSSSSNEYVVNSLVRNRSYFLLLNQFGLSKSKLQIGDEIKIFTPWEVLEVEKMGMPTIFSSYYVIKYNKLVTGGQLATTKKKIQLASRSCLCSKGHIATSLCNSGELKIFADGSTGQNKEMQVSEAKSFNSVLDKKLFHRMIKHHMWTVLEALEYSGGKPDVLVNITALIRRVISSRNCADAGNQIKNGQPSQYILICQDPSGTFFIISIPNRPLTSKLQSLINEGEGSIQTLSNLLVCHRITNYHSPSLFSLIHSLQISYKMSIESDAKLKGLLVDSLTKPLQTFCYKFLASLGKTENFVETKSSELYFKEQLWSIEETFSNERCGQRGKLIVNIIYYFHPYLYVICPKNSKEKINRFTSLQRLTVKTGIWLPLWICCDGTVLAAAIVRDVLMTKSSGLLIDEYSSILKMNKEIKVKMADLLKLAPKLTADAVAYDLVKVEGFIVSVIEENAYIWLECEYCFEYLPDADMLWCQKCELENTTPLVKFSMDIELIDPDTKIGPVKITLCQKTIEMLLKTCKLVNNVAYDSSTLCGKRLIPHVCVIKSIGSKNSSNSAAFNLTELPY